MTFFALSSFGSCCLCKRFNPPDGFLGRAPRPSLLSAGLSSTTSRASRAGGGELAGKVFMRRTISPYLGRQIEAVFLSTAGVGGRRGPATAGRLSEKNAADRARCDTPSNGARAK